MALPGRIRDVQDDIGVAQKVGKFCNTGNVPVYFLQEMKTTVLDSMKGTIFY